jgi:hypothetical protein
MLDSLEGVCAGQVRFEYPATSVLLSNLTDATLRACGSGTRRGADPASGGRVCLPHQGSSWAFLAAVSHDTTVWCVWCHMGLLVLVVVVLMFW